MITDSIKKIEAGAAIADDTARSLASIVEGSSVSTNMINNIVTGSNEQSLGITQINQGLNQLNQVVQSNASIAEESATASQEMDNEMSLLEQLTKRFKLRQTSDDNRFTAPYQLQTGRKTIESGASGHKQQPGKTLTFNKSYDDFISS